MTKYEDMSGHTPQSVGQYICSETEFERETDKPDGASLAVVDEATDKVSKYCIAYHGRWRDL